MSVLSAKHFHDEEAAYALVEAQIWAEGRVCPHCGTIDNSARLAGKSTRIGVYKCRDCRKPFTVKVGTIFEASHIPMHIWLQAIALMSSSKKGISANQLHRTLGVTLKSAWFMAHRIRMAMAPAPGTLEPMGGDGSVIEADETYYGPISQPLNASATGKVYNRNPRRRTRRGKYPGPVNKRAIVSLVQRGGAVRSFHVPEATKETVKEILRKNVDAGSRVFTDTAGIHKGGYKNFAGHEMVNHSRGEYVRGDVHTNTIEGYFSIFKRGMTGIYQHCSEQHLHRYLAEFDFRYSNRIKLGVDDAMRAARTLQGAKGKRLTYRTVEGSEAGV
jgi:transposase-like protein